MAENELPSSLQISLDGTKVSYVQLGKSGLRVSVPILGGMSFGHKQWQPWVLDDEATVNKILKAAYDQGLNTFDTANAYSNGLSETMIGNFLKSNNIPRNKIIILSKCFSPVGEEPSVLNYKYPDTMAKSKDYVNQGGLSRAAIFNAVEASLQRLGTTYLDLLQVHRFDKSVPVEETMKALHDLVEQGKVRYIGASSMWAYQFSTMQHVAEIHGWTKFISMQNHYSLCYREEEREMNPYCEQTGVGLMAWSPLYGGLLARPLNHPATQRQEATKSQPTPEDEKIIDAVQKIAEQKGWTMSQLALVWLVHKSSIPIVGMGSLERLSEAIEIHGKKLTSEEIASLEKMYKPRSIIGHA
ncbi:hypothetical protein B0A52_04268 [Exophiala mesophila]|uniref:NADP-dependent oxidoreductase domain-containing protein n=1 Tax=Exophiala mesophila TaxID=212818 RepID=A0A438N8A0_EXOME|nr:hypothetical protein B0A52_04268 [Exophiala mesophila]